MIYDEIKRVSKEVASEMLERDRFEERQRLQKERFERCKKLRDEAEKWNSMVIKDGDIVKFPDGNYYKLTPVTAKG